MHRTLINPLRQPPQPLTKTAEFPHQSQFVPITQLQAGFDTQAPKLVRRDFAHAMQLIDRQGRHEIINLIRGDHEQAVGLAPVTGNFGQKLVGGYPGRHRDMQLIGNAPADVLSYARGTAGKMRAVGYIQIGFIQRQRLNQLGVVAQDAVNLSGRFFISIHPAVDDNQVRAQLERMPGRHCRAHAISPSFIITGRDDPAPISRAPDSHRLVCQARVITHLNSGIETVTVDVDDFALRHVRRCSSRR